SSKAFLNSESSSTVIDLKASMSSWVLAMALLLVPERSKGRCSRLLAELVDSGLHKSHGVAQQRLEHSEGLRERGLEEAGDLGEQLVARRQLGQRLDLFGLEGTVAEQAALQHQAGRRLGEITQRLGRRRRITLHERDRDR